MTDMKCPKCGSHSFQIADYYTTAYLYDVFEGNVNSNGEDNENGEHIRTVCTCYLCNHRWNPRPALYTIDK